MPSASPITTTSPPITVRKPTLPTLKTPRSAGPLPSELPRSPLSGWLDTIKQEDDLKTPITPPTAYTDFLKALSPAISSPSSSFSTTSSYTDKSGKLTPISQPSSAGSLRLSSSCDNLKATSAPLIPPSPFVRPHASRTPSARTPTALRKLRIPQSPVFSPVTDSPRSGVRSAAMSSAMRSPFSPADWIIEGKTKYFESPRSACHRPVSVRQVVTRTVTYTQTPLDPAPKGKRRKLE